MQEIEKSLHKLKLPGMADCWTSLCETRRADKLSLKDGLQLMLQTEQDTRKTNRITRLLKEAAFPLDKPEHADHPNTVLVNAVYGCFLRKTS